jgi:hypothetical protein
MSIALKGHSGQRGVGDELGKSGTVKLSELNTSDSRSRIWSDSSDYKRVNSNEIARGHAPAPDGNTSNSYGTANSLAEWEGYEQFNDEDDRGSNMDISALDDDSATFTWTLPSGYANFAGNTAMSDVKQDLYVKECSDQTETEAHAQNGCEDENPFAGSSHGATDGTTLTAASLDELTWYIGSVRMSWNDKDNGGSWYHVGGSTSPYRGYLAVASPAFSNTERDTVNEDAIIFKTTVAAVCTAISVGLSTTSNQLLGGCEACTNWDYVGNRTDVKVNYTGFAANKYLYNNSGNCVSGNLLSYTQKWASHGDTAYALSSGHIASSAAVDCQADCEA